MFPLTRASILGQEKYNSGLSWSFPPRPQSKVKSADLDGDESLGDSETESDYDSETESGGDKLGIASGSVRIADYESVSIPTHTKSE